MTRVQCAIWGDDAEELNADGDARAFLSPRAGGQYLVSGSAEPGLAALSPVEKAALTLKLVDLRRAGELAPMITTTILEEIRGAAPLPVSERKVRFFRALAERGYGLTDTIRVGGVVDEESLTWQRLLASRTGATSSSEVHQFLKVLEEAGYLRHPDGATSTWRLTDEGFKKLEEATSKGADTLQAFVAMWFDASMEVAWQAGIKPGISDAGYRPFRVDQHEHNGKIDDLIVAEIRRSRFVVADFTCDSVEHGNSSISVPRGGVYYEAGLAHGLGMEVIFCCRRDRLGDVHFDTRQFAHVVWDAPGDLREKIYNRIVATIGETRTAPGRGKS